MTDSYALTGTLKAGKGYEAPWIVVYANTPDELKQKLDSIGTSGAVESLVNASSLLHGAYNVQQGLQPAAPQAPAPQAAQAPAQAPQQGVWGSPTPAPQWAQPQPGVSPAPVVQQGPTLHPESKGCTLCGQVLQYKVVNRKSDGKQFTFWACPNQSSKDDGHSSEFAS